MAPFLSAGFGNPSSVHVEGRKAKSALEEARERTARCLGCGSSEVVFTSGGSESNNLAIRGLVESRGGGHVITSAVEHPAVLEVVLGLEIEGRIELTIVGVDRYGRVDPEAVSAALRQRHGACDPDAGEQRGGHLAASERGRGPLPGSWDRGPFRCGSGRGQGAGERGRSWRRPVVGGRAQALRSERCGGTLRSGGRRDHASDPWRWPRAGSACGHRECPSGCWVWGPPANWPSTRPKRSSRAWPVSAIVWRRAYG